MFNMQCVNNPSNMVHTTIEQVLEDGQYRNQRTETCGYCLHAVHRTKKCDQCRTEARILRLEQHAGLEAPNEFDPFYL